MQKSIEVSGKNEAAAIASALTRLGLDRDDVSVEVLERAKSGFLGFGSSPARVRVSYEAPDEIFARPAAPAPKAAPVASKPAAAPAPKAAPAASKPAPAPKAAPMPTAAAAPAAVAVIASATAEVATVQQETSAPAPRASRPAPSRDDAPFDAAIAAQIESFLVGLMQHMKVEAKPVISHRTSGGYQVVLEGAHLGTLIGHRGETLDSIQQLCNYSLNRGRNGARVRVHLDVEGYRQKREEALRRLAEKVAMKVSKYRRNVTLEPMNAYERHVIHEALQDKPDITTFSTGTEPHRRTVVAYARGKTTK